jgi:hypothetical protein
MTSTSHPDQNWISELTGKFHDWSGQPACAWSLHQRERESISIHSVGDLGSGSEKGLS